VRFIGLDVHRDFCEVAIAEEGRVRSAGRFKTNPEEVTLFAQSLAPDDAVALEATFGATKIAQLIEPHVARVVVANTRLLAAIAKGRAKTDRRDAQSLARLLAGGFLDEVWPPDQRVGTLRRLVARRAALMRARNRAKNECHAALARSLAPRPPMRDAFGKSGRRWLAELELVSDERLTVDGCLRQIDFLSEEILLLDRELARQALDSPEIRRLMTVPGVSVGTACAFMASVGEIRRFATPKQVVAYLGLDPRVRQSGSEPARHGRISKAGASEARHMVGEAAWSVAKTAGPMRAFFDRVEARRGPQVAATATARKLCVLFWHLLTREEDYAFARPMMTRHKLRELELRAGAKPQRGRQHAGGPLRSRSIRAAEQATSKQAELAYRRFIADWKQANPHRKEGAGATRERASFRPSSRQAARQGSAPEPAL
jgi:transposase